ncbi:pseudouridine synthase [Bacillus toyonensis]|nr:pseudouridine synthase [Bacillus toyonensis]
MINPAKSYCGKKFSDELIPYLNCPVILLGIWTDHEKKEPQVKKRRVLEYK